MAKKDEAPTDFDWLTLSQPTEDPITVGKNEPPYWVEDKQGTRFATYVLDEGLKLLDESPFNRSGELRAAVPAGASDPAVADSEGDQQ